MTKFSISKAGFSAFLVFLLFCGVAVSSVQAQVTLTGKISNPVSDSVLLELYTVPASYSGESYTVALSAKGEFTLKAPMKEAMLGELVHGSESIILFLQPGDALNVRLEAKNFLSSLKLKGKGFPENNFLLQFEKKFDEEEDYQVLPDNIHKREKEFLQFLDERREDQLYFLEKFQDKNKVSDQFIGYVKAQIAFNYANDRLTYVDIRKRVGDLPPKLSPNYYDFLSQVNLNDPLAIRSQAYLEFLNNYFQYKALKENPANLTRDFYPTLFAMAKKELKGVPREMMMSRILSQSFRFGFVPDADAMYLDFLKEAKQPLYVDFIKTQYKKFRRVGLGTPAPAFTLLSATGDSVSLEKYKGKIVYLGFWRTHCGICSVDQQAYKHFAQELAAKDIVLLQVSVGEDLAAWKKAMAQNKLPGVHLYAPDLSAQILKDYDVKSFPTYFMIAPDGTLFNTNARRPGHAEGARDVATAIDKYREGQGK